MYKAELDLITIKLHYPEIYEAYQTTVATLAMMDYEFPTAYKHYPDINLSYDDNNRLRIMIDFSVGCTFFARYNRMGRFDMNFSAYVPDDFDFPSYFTFDNIGEWMHQIVYQNYLYELTAEES